MAGTSANLGAGVVSERAENNFRLELYRELDDIVSAMKNLAQVELHRVSKAEATQSGAWQTAISALQAVQQPGIETNAEHSSPLLLLIGSERGFCGGFNEQVVRTFLQDETPVDATVMVVGSRLANKLPLARFTQAFAGPSSGDEVLPCVQGMMDILLAQPLPTSVRALSHGPDGLKWQALLPGSEKSVTTRQQAFQTLLPATALQKELQWQCLQQGLLRLLLVSLKNENRHRLQQMEGAREHLEELTQTLRLRINALRQQEIVEEIEVILVDQHWD